MSLYRRGRIWWIELTSDKGRVRESSGTSDRERAKEYHEKRKSEIWRQDRLGEAPPVTWGQAVVRWLGIKPRPMQERYLIGALNISPKADLPLTGELLERLLKGRSAGTTARYLSLVVAIHNASGVQPPKMQRPKQPTGRTRWLTLEEWSRLRECLEVESPLLRQCAEFTLATGLRENNVLNLRWDQADLRRRQAWFYADQMKGKAQHGLHLSDEAMAVLEARRGIHKVWVFGNPDHPLTRASNRAWYAAIKKAKLKGFRWHDLRHTFASWAIMSGVRLEELQRIGGWKTAQMVQRYAHLSNEHLAAAINKVKPVSLRYNQQKKGVDDTNSPTKGT